MSCTVEDMCTTSPPPPPSYSSANTLCSYVKQHNQVAQVFVARRKVSNEGSRDGELEDLYEDDAFTECAD